MDGIFTAFSEIMGVTVSVAFDYAWLATMLTVLIGVPICAGLGLYNAITMRRLSSVPPMLKVQDTGQVSIPLDQCDFGSSVPVYDAVEPARKKSA